MKTFKIGDRVFIVKKLVMVQTRALLKELSKLGIQPDSGDVILKKITNFTGNEMPRILACVLSEENKLFPKSEDEFEDLVLFLDNNLEMEQATEIMQSFLELSQSGMKSPS